MKSCKSWGYIATVIIGLALVSGALADRLTTFAWDPNPSWPLGTTIELCGNGPTCQSGLTGLSATLSLPVNPGEVIQGMARAIPPPGYQCGEPLTDCLPSEWATVQATWPAIPINGWARYQREEVTPVADPSFAELGTLDYRAENFTNSLSSTIQNVGVGDLIVVVVQRNFQNLITGVASTSPALTFTKLATAQSSGVNGFDTELWGAIATTAASSMVVTASYSDPYQWGSMFTARYTPGIASITPHATTAHTTLQSSSTNRTNANMTTTKRSLLIVFGTNWDHYYLISAATNWTKRVDSDTFGNDTTTQFLLDRVADAGTYPSGNYGTNATADYYMSGIVALEIEESGGSASALPRRALDGPFYGALKGSIR